MSSCALVVADESPPFCLLDGDDAAAPSALVAAGSSTKETFLERLDKSIIRCCRAFLLARFSAMVSFLRVAAAAVLVRLRDVDNDEDDDNDDDARDLTPKPCALPMSAVASSAETTRLLVGVFMIHRCYVVEKEFQLLVI